MLFGGNGELGRDKEESKKNGASNKQHKHAILNNKFSNNFLLCLQTSLKIYVYSTFIICNQKLVATIITHARQTYFALSKKLTSKL